MFATKINCCKKSNHGKNVFYAKSDKALPIYFQGLTLAPLHMQRKQGTCCTDHLNTVVRLKKQ